MSGVSDPREFRSPSGFRDGQAGVSFRQADLATASTIPIHLLFRGGWSEVQGRPGRFPRGDG